MKYKILVLDIDGTLTDKRNVLTPFTLSTLTKVQQKGVKVVLASGRPTYGIMPLAKELGLDTFGGYILSFNGGKIINVSTMETIYESILEKELLPDLYQMTSQAGAVLLTYQNEFIITEDPDDKYAQHEMYLTKMKAKKVEDFCAAVDFAPDKCLAVGDPEKLVPLEATILEKFSDKMNAYRSQDFFLELVPKGIDKAQSLERLLKHTGLEREEMIAVGDGFNDLSMIKYAGLGVAMENAQQAVKDAADYITLSNDEDGVAVMAHKFIL